MEGFFEKFKGKKHDSDKKLRFDPYFLFMDLKKPKITDYYFFMILNWRKASNFKMTKLNILYLKFRLAAKREAYLKDKNVRQRDFKSALDFQVKTKPMELPKAFPDGEVFGQYDMKNEKLAQNKKREVEAAKFNLEYYQQQKREELLNGLREHEVDYENTEKRKEE